MDPSLPVWTSLGDQGRILGEGTYGKVVEYRKTVHGTVEKYAVKISTANKNELPADMIREAACLRRLNHPNVINLLTISSILIPKTYLMAMPLAAGTLDDYIHKTPKPVCAAKGSRDCKITNFNQRKLWAYQLCAGVQYCLALNVIHRDLKPQNLLIMPDGVLKIADFGMARALSCAPGTGMTHEVVTLYYRAPEILLGGNYGPESDLWSVGCILYELFEEQKLVEGNDEHHQIIGIFNKMGTPDPVKPESLRYWPEAVDMPEWDSVKTIHVEAKQLTSRHLDDPAELYAKLLIYRPLNRTPLETVMALPIFNDIRKSDDVPPIPVTPKTCKENLELRAFPVQPFIDHRLVGAPDMHRKARDVAKQRLFEIVEYLQYRGNTLAYAILLFDRAIQTPGLVKQPVAQAVMLACIYLSTIYNEIYFEPSDDLAKLSAGVTAVQIRNFARRILDKVMSFSLVWATPVALLKEYLVFYPESVSHRATIMIKFLLVTDFSTVPGPDFAKTVLLASCVDAQQRMKHTLEPHIIDQLYPRLIKELKASTIGAFPIVGEPTVKTGAEWVCRFKDLPILLM